MNYSYMFFNGSKHDKDFNEVVIKFTCYDEALIDFSASIPASQKLIINIIDLPQEDFLKSLELFSTLAKENVVLMIDYDTQLDLIEDIKSFELPFYFAQGASSIETMVKFIGCGVAEVLVANELGFDIVKVSEICKNNEIKVRIVANAAQELIQYPNMPLSAFFIRPEDVPIYEPYVDTIEFFGPLDRQDVLFEIYSSYKWHGKLDDLIIGLNSGIEVASDRFPPLFGPARLRCKKRCGQCNLCYDACKMAKTISENNKTITIS